MKKYTIHVLVKKYERWEIQAETQDEATDDYGSGKLLSVSDEECEITQVEVE